LVIASVCTGAKSSHASFTAKLEGQTFGSTNWSAMNVTDWSELALIPLRVHMTSGPATARTITVQFDHTKAQGSRLLQGIQNLYNFTASSNVVVSSGPTLDAPPGVDTWSYTFVVDLLDSGPGDVYFQAKLSAGAHSFPGSSLQLTGSPALGNLSIVKPAAASGAPDLAIVKLGPTNANPGATIAYSINYMNKLTGASATGVQIADTLPSEVTFLNCTGGCEVVGDTITWTLGTLAPGDNGVVTYQVTVTNILTTGFSFHNDAAIASAENDSDLSNNFSSVTTVISSNCIPPAIIAQPADAAACVGDAVVFSVVANGSAALNYQWRKDSVNIPSATNSSLTLNPVSLSDSGDYDVVVENSCGTQTSAAAHLLVGGAVIVSGPSNALTCEGHPAALHVEADGTSLTYQWRKEGTNITGATSSSFEISAATPADAGSYDVVITAACGAPVVSSPASITVKAAPVASDDNYSTDEDMQLIVPAPGILSNDTDADGESLTATLMDPPIHGSVSLNSDGSFMYTPAVGFYGGDSFTYRAGASCGLSESATVTVAVAYVNHLPVANDDNYTILAGSALTVSVSAGVLANDTDADGDALQAILVAAPAHGSVTLNSDGSFSYMPAPNYQGADSFTYMANDASADSNVATVHIDVLANGGATDLNLYVKSAVAKLNWADLNRDGFSIRGQINPRGMNDDLSGATISLEIDGITIVPTLTLDARGIAASVAGGIKVKCRLKNTNGAYSLKVSGIDLRSALGLANQTGAGFAMINVRLIINGANLSVPVMTAGLEPAYRTTADKSSSLRFNFRKHRTLSGVFNCNKTTATDSSKGEKVRVRGVFTGDNGDVITPTGDVTLQIGASTMTIPVTSVSSAAGAWQYSGSTGFMTASLRFSNVKRGFSLSLSTDTVSLPAAGAGMPTTSDLPVTIKIPTANGVMVFESIVELKRKSPTATTWKR
jgi:uncharacterized repeat protein (TIGR01451 family)